jgi:hypothetical protein
MTPSQEKKLRVCPLCEATCGLEVTVAGNEVVQLRGDRHDVSSTPIPIACVRRWFGAMASSYRSHGARLSPRSTAVSRPFSPREAAMQSRSTSGTPSSTTSRS